jgi:hypothetical protein
VTSASSTIATAPPRAGRDRRGDLDRAADELRGAGDHRQPTRPGERVGHRGPPRSDDRTATVDHQRRGVDAIAVAARVGLLTRAPRGARPRIDPAQAIPVVDVERQRDHVGAIARQLAQHALGGRARAAALRREQLGHHHARRRRWVGRARRR